jgi:two-component system sensor histidine kinase CpxA
MIRVYARSVYVRILVKCVGALLFLLVCAYVLSWFMKQRPSLHGEMFAQQNTFDFALARSDYEGGGSPKLADALQKIRNSFPGRECFLTDSQGRDLVSGQDHSVLLAKAEPSSATPHPTDYRVIEKLSSSDGQYHFVVEAPWRLDEWNMRPYYLLILFTVMALCYSLIRDVASPVRALRQTLYRFGQGDLSVRARSKRLDEIGELSRTFDEMADRIQTLLTAERRLLQDISHELRSPLARLSLAAGLLETSDNPRPAIARVRHNVERLTELVGSLLQVTRSEGDPGARNFDQVQLCALLEHVVESCRLEAEARGCSLNLQTSNAPIVVADQELLRRAIENVVRNAIRYSPEGSSVDVNLACEDSTVAITVRDQGPGVPEQELPNIFKPFYRVDDSRDNQTGGVGLGLAIARRAIVVHGGEIAAKNENPGLLVTIKLSGESHTGVILYHC